MAANSIVRVWITTLGFLAAQSFENTDSLDVHLGPSRLPSSPWAVAAADLWTGWSGFLRCSGSGACHSVVLSVSGRWRHRCACGGGLAQPLKNADFGRWEAVWGWGRRGGGSIRGKQLEFPTQATQGDRGRLGSERFLLRRCGPLEDAGILQDRALAVGVLVIFVCVCVRVSWLQHLSAFVPLVQAAEHPGGLPEHAEVRSQLYSRLQLEVIATALTLLLLVVVSAIDSAPSLSNTEVRFKPVSEKQTVSVKHKGRSLWK